MFPIPNVVAGILIGIENSSWLEVFVVSLIWPIVLCVYISLRDMGRMHATIVQFRERAQRLLFNSPTATFFAVEFVTAFFTAMPVALITYGIKRVFI